VNNHFRKRFIATGFRFHATNIEKWTH